MTRAQFASRQNWLTCSECGGRSFSDPNKAFHWNTCSQYSAWRFGRGQRYYGIKEQVLHERALKSLGHGCTCHGDDALFPCDYCSWHYDNSDEGGEV